MFPLKFNSSRIFLRNKTFSKFYNIERLTYLYKKFAEEDDGLSRLRHHHFRCPSLCLDESTSDCEEINSHLDMLSRRFRHSACSRKLQPTPAIDANSQFSEFSQPEINSGRIENVPEEPNGNSAIDLDSTRDTLEICADESQCTAGLNFSAENCLPEEVLQRQRNSPCSQQVSIANAPPDVQIWSGVNGQSQEEYSAFHNSDEPASQCEFPLESSHLEHDQNRQKTGAQKRLKKRRLRRRLKKRIRTLLINYEGQSDESHKVTHIWLQNPQTFLDTKHNSKELKAFCLMLQELVNSHQS